MRKECEKSIELNYVVKCEKRALVGNEALEEKSYFQFETDQMNFGAKNQMHIFYSMTYIYKLI